MKAQILYFPTTYPIARIVLLVAIVGGTILRLSATESRGLWGDEIFSLAVSTGHSGRFSEEEIGGIFKVEHYRSYVTLAPTYFSDRLLTLLRTDTQLPLYYFLLNLWLHLFGTSEVALRSLSVLASIGTIPVVYMLGRRLSSEEVGVYAALIFAFAPYQIAYGGYARPYALMAFLAGISTLIALRLCEQGRKTPWLFAYFVAGALGLYTHYLFVWNVLFHIGLVVVRQRTNRSFLKSWSLTLACVAAAFLFVSGILMDQIFLHRSANPLTWSFWYSGRLPWSEAPVYLGRSLWLFLSVGTIEGLCSQQEQCSIDSLLTGMSYAVPLLVLAGCAWQFLRSSRVSAETESTAKGPWRLCFVWGLCTFSGPLAMDIFMGSHAITTAYYFISASLPLYLGVAMASVTIANRRVRTYVVSGLLVFLLASSGFYLEGFARTIKYEPGMREVARYVDGLGSETDIFVFLNTGPSPINLAYYLGTNIDVGILNIWRPSLSIPEQLQKLTIGRKRVWYLDDSPPELYAQGRNATLAWLRTYYRETAVPEFENLYLFLFSSP